MRLPYFAYKILSIGKKQITWTLPRSFWDRVEIEENGELLVELQETRKLILQRSDVLSDMETSFSLRKSVAEKLYRASEKLPEGIKLAVIEGYRSMEKQQRAWNRKYDVVKSENPNWNEEQINQEVGLVVARPGGITNHICGGAVDVMLVDQNNKPLDFGTEYAPADESGRKKCPMFAVDLTDEQKQNRKLLRNRMESVGFVWYPGEWWHYCYGDRMWALYSGRKKCFYGLIHK